MPVGTKPLIPLTGIEVNIIPLHSLVVIAVIAGIGFIVTVIVNEAPVQFPDVGVT